MRTWGSYFLLSPILLAQVETTQLADRPPEQILNQKLMVIETDRLRLDQLPVGVRDLRVDPSRKKIYFYLDATAVDGLPVDQRHKSAPFLVGGAPDQEWTLPNTLKASSYDNLWSVDSEGLRPDQLPPGVTVMGFDSAGTKAYLYINPDAMNAATIGNRYTSAQRLRVSDYMDSLCGPKRRGPQITYPHLMYMTPLTPIPISFGRPSMPLRAAPGGGPVFPAPIVSPSSRVLDLVGDFLARRFQGKGRLVKYPKDQVSVRRVIVGMHDEVLRGAGLWERLDILLTVVHLDGGSYIIQPVLDLSTAAGRPEPSESRYAPVESAVAPLVSQYGSALMAELQKFVESRQP